MWPRPNRAPPLTAPPPRPITPSTPPAHRTLARKRRAPPPAGLDRAALLAALREKAKSLAVCPIPPDQAPEISARLRITPKGAIDRVDLRGTRLSTALERCYRQEILGWRLEAVRLEKPTTVLVALELHTH